MHCKLFIEFDRGGLKVHFNKANVKCDFSTNNYSKETATEIKAIDFGECSTLWPTCDREIVRGTNDDKVKLKKKLLGLPK